MSIVDEYNLNGFVGPLQILTQEETQHYRDAFVTADEKWDLMHSDYRCKSNVLFPWVDEITRNPRLVSYVQQLIGPNIHCWDTMFWIKKPRDGKDVSFHQDATYWNIDNKHNALTVWLALDDATPKHGSIEYIQGSHRVFQQRHRDIKTKSNLLMRGQTVDVDLPNERVKTTVPAGHALIHGPYVIHGSGQNCTSTTRFAIGMIFASTVCKPVLQISPESTIMICGTDEHNYMLHDPRPTGIWQDDLVNWQLAYDRQHLNYYQMEQS
jgi:ectoine hydroxylase-related dioxygenase (phytanoyl-CoA dioxygenase family)